MDAHVTTDSGIPGEHGEDAVAPDAPDTVSAPARKPRRRRRLRWTALGASVVVLAAAGIGWSLFHRLEDNIRTDTHTARELARHAEERPEPAAGETRNILLLGSDSRDGRNARYGRAIGARSDTTILLHLPADRDRASAVSIPRDLMVDIPSCRRADGARTQAQFAQFNWAFQFGGAACTIRTVEQLTGVRIDHHLIIDFQGFTDVVNAVGGVEVCIPHEVHDPDARLHLQAGRQRLNGKEALGYVRARKALGDGSDTQRMARQQGFLASLLRKVRSEEILTTPSKLYPVLDAATSALTADEGLDSLRELYGLVRGLRATPAGKVEFRTVPRRPYALNPNRDELVQPDAARLFGNLRGETHERVTHTTTPEATPGSSPQTHSAYRGSTDASGVCTPDGRRNRGN
jgi:LCP family protein required for cell wall assembly